MKHIDSVFERRNVEDAMFESGVDSDLPNASSNSGHRLPVVWLESLLHAAKLEARDAAGITRKSP